ncbi:hypothetical protein [Flavobacterium sp. M31R6]|uniref:hypothetical protein n=1 Tax=Flavobacterium sp. M31R6 TaxID=2739062 RepID=UPI0015693B54|nr:hypothetical protein [Flavobacterium sp. M31R6]QKJ61969.1 hypothetical protein HQN62_02100 [Flavobacterium sp. M31R6]
MSVQKENNPENPEIDLLTVFSRIGDFFEWINTLLFRIIRFFVKNAIAVAVLIVLGFGIGFLLEKVNRNYEQKIIVAPNFKSAEYLYSKIEFLASKAALRDTLFFKSIGIQKPSSIVSIAIEPIVDVYNLMNKNGENVDLLQLMAQNGDLKSIIKETTTNKNYDLQTITIKTLGSVTVNQTVEPLLNYLNTSSYFDTYKKINSQNISNNIKTKEATILQIDAILNQFSGTYGNHPNNEKLVYYNENLNLGAVIKTKDSLVNQIDKLKIEQYNTDKTIKERGVVLNIKNNKSIKGKLIFILPLVFVGLFVLYHFFTSFYKKQSLKANLKLK